MGTLRVNFNCFQVYPYVEGQFNAVILGIAMATYKPNNIDWDMPEYQNALKVVIKYEIQTLVRHFYLY